LLENALLYAYLQRENSERKLTKSAVRGILHDEGQRNGHGFIDLPLDHRSPWRKGVGIQ
jgi:hypothetical protein